MVFSGLMIACRFATCPTSTSPSLVNATTEGVKRLPSSLMMTLGSPPSMIATTEFVVPKSIPMIFVAMNRYLLYRSPTTGSHATAAIPAVSDETMITEGTTHRTPTRRLQHAIQRALLLD